MARRRRAEVRQLQPDLVYGDVLVTAFINKIMRDGKKNLAARIFYDACKIIQEKTGQEPLKVFKQATARGQHELLRGVGKVDHVPKPLSITTKPGDAHKFAVLLDHLPGEVQRLHHAVAPLSRIDAALTS